MVSLKYYFWFRVALCSLAIAQPNTIHRVTKETTQGTSLSERMALTLKLIYGLSKGQSTFGVVILVSLVCEQVLPKLAKAEGVCPISLQLYF